MRKKLQLILIITFFLGVNVFAQSKQRNLKVKNDARIVTSITKSETKTDKNSFKNRDANDFVIQIPPGEALVFKYDRENSQLEQYIFPTYQNLTETSKQAIAKAPKWLRNDLRNSLVQISATYQNKWANAILDAQDPYIDETAFVISALSPEYLQSSYAHTEMLEINAEYIYKYDTLFDYVEIKDYGTSADDDYYSTTEYKMKDAGGNIVTKEIPKEIYYWYIVHPQITDEIPGFVNVEQHESTHTGIMTTPANGVFWRQYMFAHNNANIPNTDFGSYTGTVNANANITAIDNGIAQAEYEALAQHVIDSLQNTPVYWDSENLGLVSPYMPESYYKNNVIALLNRYAWSCTRFYSVSAVERPHQPARILRWGMGRCGEFEDLTVALGRTALIPVAGIEGLSADHVFNTFYDPMTITKDNDFNIDNWKVWETTITGFVNSYINHDGDGNRWASLRFMRSDGHANDIISQFSNQTAIIKIYVKDATGNPIDGAHVVLASKQASGTNIQYDNARTTDQNGLAEFTVGNGRVYYAKIFAQGQEVPDGNYVSAVTSNLETVGGQTYTNNITFTGLTLETLNSTNQVNNFTPNSGETIEFNLNVDEEIVFGKNLWNDQSSSYWYGTKIREHRQTSPKIRIFQCNIDNIIEYTDGDNDNFTAFNENANLTSLNETTQLPDEDLYFVIRNDNIQNYVQLSGNITLKDGSGTTLQNFIPDVEDGLPFPVASSISKINNSEIKIFPNPSNGIFTIYFPIELLSSAGNDLLSSDEGEQSNVIITNITGKIVKQLSITNQKSIINLKNQPSGIYFIKIKTKNNIIIKKIIKN